MAAQKPDALTEEERQLLRDYAEGMRLREKYIAEGAFEPVDGGRLMRSTRELRFPNQQAAACAIHGEPVVGGDLWTDPQGYTMNERRAQVDARAARRAARRVKRAYERGERGEED